MRTWPARLYGSAYLAYHLRGQARFPFQPPAVIARARDRRVRQMVLHAYRSVPYYRELLPRLGLSPADFRTADDLARLPILEREDVGANPYAFLSSAYRMDRCVASRTGGSTGKSLPILHDSSAVLQSAAYQWRDQSLLARLVGRSFGYRELIFSSAVGVAGLVERFGHARSFLPSGLRIQRRYHAVLDPPEAAVRLLNDFKPHLLKGFGSGIAKLFAQLEREGAPFHRPCAVSYSGDALPAGARALIEQRFGIPVFSTYQAAEAFKIGFECERHAGLHLNADLYPLRVVDADGRTAPHGEVGDVVVSNLVNRAMVLLNYRIGDCAVLAADPCACGRTLPLLAHLEGRSGEALIGVQGRRLTATALESAFWSALSRTLLHQVEQRAPDRIHWRIVPRATADREALRAVLVENGRKYFGDDVAVEVEFLDDLPRTERGKVRSFVLAPAGSPR